MTSCRVAVTTIALAFAPAICLAQQPASPPRVGANRDCADRVTPPMDHATMDHATMDHAAHAAALENCADGVIPTSAGQAAFGAISEVVRILKADPNTDWSKVNVEALRQHLIDMNDVTMHTIVEQRNIPGGMDVDVTGAGQTIGAIRRMTIAHSAMLEQGNDYHASAKQIPNGVRLTVTAKTASDARTVAQIRGLGFAGIMTESDHHARHHVAIARGEPVHNQ